MKTAVNKPKEVTLFIKLLYFEYFYLLFSVYDEYDPMTDSMYLFLLIFFGFALFMMKDIKDFSRGDKDAYKDIRVLGYILIAFFFIIVFLLNDKPVMEYLQIHQVFALYPLIGIINTIWLNSKVVKDWFAKQ